MKIFMISLGCAKNQVDSEMILGLCQKENINVTDDPKKADILMVNTCGFIESAKEEAINTILELTKYKKGNKKLIVCGCLAQRYQDDLIKAIPEVDRFIKIDEYGQIAQILNTMLKTNYNICLSPMQRLYITPKYYRYVKISEGCTNRCAYCAIPLIRGDLKCREIADIKSEVMLHVAEGVKEINIISQDTTKYGFDIYNRLALVDLLKELVSIAGDFKIRLLYLYPNIITDELIDFIKNNAKVVPYFDIPIQHSEDKLLKLMNRRGTKEEIANTIKKIRQEIPHSIIRTTLIVGFPYETDEDVDNLGKFIVDYPFDRLGVFTYSAEEGTSSALMPQIISEEEKNRRYNQIMDIQAQISLKLNRQKIGHIYDVLIENYNEDEMMYEGRSYAFAPDDIDGTIFIAAHDELNPGDVVKVKILDADQYTLTGEQLDE